MTQLEIALSALAELQTAADRYLNDPGSYTKQQLRLSLDRAKAAERMVAKLELRQYQAGAR